LSKAFFKNTRSYRTAMADVSHRAFTLLEVMIVIVVMSILAITIVPALSSAQGAQGAGAANEIERMLLLARAKAMATSVSHAVRFDAEQSSLQLCWREPTSGNVEGVVANDGQEWPIQLLAGRFGTVQLTSAQVDGLSSQPVWVWFAFNGVPELRNGNGVRIADATRDAVITLSDGSVVTVVAKTGAVTVSFGGAP
jgi:prepilin-type N-terminal cleavage/methylation domain-containing protein